MRKTAALIFVALTFTLNSGCSDDNSTDPSGPDNEDDDFTWVEFAAGNISCRFKEEFSDNPELSREFSAYYWTGTAIEIQKSPTEENVFIGGWNRPGSNGETDKGSIQISFDDTRDTILTVSFNEQRTDASLDFEYELNFSAQNIEYGTDSYKVTGDGVIENNSVILDFIRHEGTYTKTILYLMESRDTIIYLKLYKETDDFNKDGGMNYWR